MKLNIKAALTAAMALGAVFSARSAVLDIRRGGPAAPPEYEYAWSCAMEDAAFVLRSYDGRVGVFDSAAAGSPMTVTDIEVACLRQADRAMLEAGIAVADRDELLSLLEDLGS